MNGTDHRRSSSYRPYSVYQQTMHPAILRDADATNKLFEAILDTPGGRRSLSRLARTCKAFKEPVLDILWRDLDSLAPLIGLFPNTLLKRARRPGLGLVRFLPMFAEVESDAQLGYGQAKNPERDDWNRLLAYGERVRSISYMESSGNISPTIFPILEELRPRQWLLPNLTSLTWKSETAAGLERCRLFLGPELRNITLEVGTKHPKLNDLLVEIASHARLSSLAFTLHTNLPDNFTDIFLNNLSLEKVCIAAPGALSARVGLWAAQLPKLRSFTVDLTGRTTTAVEGFFDDISPGSGASTPSSVGGTDSGVFSGDELDFSEIRKSAVRLTGDGPRHGAFAHLTHLQLSGETSNVATFLKHLTSPLTHLELLIDDPPASEDWQDVCGLVCEQFSYTLQVFRVSPTSASRFQELVRSTSRGGDTPVRHLPLTHLGPLPRLHRLDIDLPESVLFHESDIAHLANMCPSLEILRLGALARWPSTVGPPALTLEGLVPLMRQCRRLHTLAVVVNALDGSEGILSTREVSSRSLQRLHVGHSWIKDPLQTAILLSHVAPFLDNLKWFHEKNRAVVVEANALAWQKVSEFLPHLQNIRLAERRQQPQPQVYVPPPTAEKAVDATVITVDQGILAKPQLVESEVQAEVEFADASVQMAPEVESVSVDATPVLVDTGILVVPTFAERAVDARPETEEKAIDMRGTPPLETTSRPGNIAGVVPSVLSYLPSPATGLVSLTFRVARFYTFPFRYMYSFMPSLSKSADALQAETEPKSPVPGEQEEDLAEKHENGNTLSPSQETAVSPVGL